MWFMKVNIKYIIHQRLSNAFYNILHKFHFIISLPLTTVLFYGKWLLATLLPTLCNFMYF